jgi:hypothetical protein
MAGTTNELQIEHEWATCFQIQGFDCIMRSRSIDRRSANFQEMIMLTILLYASLSALMESDANVPEPSVNRIHYDRPQDYLVLNESLGDRQRIEKLAGTLKADTPQQTLLAIGRWIQSNLKYDDQAAYAWRNFDTALDTRTCGSCADHALVFAALARACGIPAVFVKSMDADWIYEFRTSGVSDSWRGHVFLEVHLGGRWQLLDAQAMQLYQDYQPAMRILPGSRYAYDKGADPRELVLSLDWERWKQQTIAYFSKFDLSQLPVGRGRALGAVYVAANSPVYQAVTQRLHALGHASVYSFNTAFDKYLRQAIGSDLIITAVGTTVVLPEAHHARFLPITVSELTTKLQTEPAGVLRKQLDDGTRVVLIYGKNLDAIQDAIGQFQLTAER